MTVNCYNNYYHYDWNELIYFYIVHMSNVTLGVEISVLNRLRILMYLCDEMFGSCCKKQFLHPFMTLQLDVSKVSRYNLGYNCTSLN